ncbi:uncharacterized protein AMSG_11509 [Thecamonas trahens ATCC 50062]|uniref:Polycomb protein VEFS-Box domain-containing protein n=1 Tax=Thecamonas trahens ATCC 50062 TaxID=461836 RepID=A0A0L0DWM0_THETB|nr:hypothetical protein AMSG_11509 [Thecamonas trahens ATCC 50062]KNC56491.1 hypothetical protein AMSG_11509 [Thecamonas trahens ATCC 50062]|eukprot:XP_013752636.1 hypothetical protein AMSG_11509 [Thecamonas trahens ATCC 50062]
MLSKRTDMRFDFRDPNEGTIASESWEAEQGERAGRQRATFEAAYLPHVTKHRLLHLRQLVSPRFLKRNLSYVTEVRKRQTTAAGDGVEGVKQDEAAGGGHVSTRQWNETVTRLDEMGKVTVSLVSIIDAPSELAAEASSGATRALKRSSSSKSRDKVGPGPVAVLSLCLLTRNGGGAQPMATTQVEEEHSAPVNLARTARVTSGKRSKPVTFRRLVSLNDDADGAQLVISIYRSAEAADASHAWQGSNERSKLLVLDPSDQRWKAQHANTRGMTSRKRSRATAESEDGWWSGALPLADPERGAFLQSGTYALRLEGPGADVGRAPPAVLVRLDWATESVHTTQTRLVGSRQRVGLRRAPALVSSPFMLIPPIEWRFYLDESMRLLQPQVVNSLTCALCGDAHAAFPALYMHVVVGHGDEFGFQLERSHQGGATIHVVPVALDKRTRDEVAQATASKSFAFWRPRSARRLRGRQPLHSFSMLMEGAGRATPAEVAALVAPMSMGKFEEAMERRPPVAATIQQEFFTMPEYSVLPPEAVGSTQREPVDNRWLMEKRAAALRELGDVSETEKTFMALWNTFVSQLEVQLSDGRLAPALLVFVKECAQELVVANLRNALVLHCTNLWNHGAISASDATHALETYDQQAAAVLCAEGGE